MDGNINMIPYHHSVISDAEMMVRAEQFYNWMNQRRSLRFFSDKAVPKEIIHHLIMTASSAPSGAHKQPWFFCAVSSQELKRKIRIAAEEEEFINYHGRMSESWLDDLKKFDTNHVKPFLEIAPWLIIIFKKSYDIVDNQHMKNYYVSESVGIAAGMLITAIHNAGLVTLTHTPSPMDFLQKILNRPVNEKPYLLLPVGHPAEDAVVPMLQRKEIDDVSTFFE